MSNIDTRTLYQALLSAKIFCEDVRNYPSLGVLSSLTLPPLLTRELDNLEPILEEALLLLNDQPNE